MCFCAVCVWLLTLKKQPLCVERLRDWPSRHELQWDVWYHRCYCSQSYLAESELLVLRLQQLSYFVCFVRLWISIRKVVKNVRIVLLFFVFFVLFLPNSPMHQNSKCRSGRQSVFVFVVLLVNEESWMAEFNSRTCTVLHLQIIFTGAHCHVATCS